MFSGAAGKPVVLLDQDGLLVAAWAEQTQNTARDAAAHNPQEKAKSERLLHFAFSRSRLNNSLHLAECVSMCLHNSNRDCLPALMSLLWSMDQCHCRSGLAKESWSANILTEIFLQSPRSHLIIKFYWKGQMQLIALVCICWWLKENALVLLYYIVDMKLM